MAGGGGREKKVDDDDMKFNKTNRTVQLERRDEHPINEAERQIRAPGSRGSDHVTTLTQLPCYSGNISGPVKGQM